MTKQSRKGPLSLLGYGPGGASRGVAVAATVAFVAGALLILWSTYIHFHLWNETDGYRHISIIGPLFLAQSIGGLIVAIVVVAVRRVWAAIVGIGFAGSTMVGFLLTVGLSKGLFNFKESWAAPFAGLAFCVEIAAIVVLLVAGALCVLGAAPATRTAPAPVGASSGS
jgi:hypothetical protein